MRMNTLKMPLVLWTNKLNKECKKAVEKFCRENDLPYYELQHGDVFEIKKEYDKVVELFNSNKVVIVGDNYEFPPLKFIFRKRICNSDIIYEDLGSDGALEIQVGRIFGDQNTVIYHLRGKYGYSDLAVVFDTTPRLSELPVKVLIGLGFKVKMCNSFTPNITPILENSEMILQYSDGTIFDRVHGNNKYWYGGYPPRVILSYRELETIRFKNYPLIFAEACRTANFGPLVKNAIKAGAAYLGATADTFNNTEEYYEWKECHFCDGYKYGVLEGLTKFKTIGEVKLHVEKELFETLNDTQQKQIIALEEGHKKEVKDIEVLSTIEFMLFGNPDRPVVVGKKYSFNIEKIPVFRSADEIEKLF